MRQTELQHPPLSDTPVAAYNGPIGHSDAHEGQPAIALVVLDNSVFGALAHADGPQPRRGKGHAEDIVLDTLEAFGTLNVDNIVRYFSPDILYQSTGLPDLVGLQAARDYIAPFMSVFSVIDYQVTNVLSQGGIVATERVENYVVSPNSPIGTPGVHMVLPVAGWCEVRRGLIVRWSDYYNQCDVTRQTGIPTSGC